MEQTNIAESELIEAVVYTFIAFVLMGLVLILFFYFSRKKIIKQEIENKNLQLEHQKTLLHSIIITQEEERRRIAQDLHDDISSKLNVVSLNSHLLTTPNLNDNELSEIAINIINLTKKALDSSRKIAHDLLPPVFEKFGLHQGVKELCLEYNSSKSIIIDYQNNIEFDLSENHKHLHVFRILQELLNNSVKHGKAKQSTIVFEKKNESNYCVYSDNGVGFDIHNLENQKGLGMKNIESRVSFLNGLLHIDSELNKGIKVTFNF